MEGALDFAVNSLAVSLSEADFLLLALEETNSSLMAERLLKCLLSLLHTCPRYLQQSLVELRYAETIALHLISVFDTANHGEVIRSNLMLLLWTLKESIGGVPKVLLGVCKEMQGIPISTVRSRYTGEKHSEREGGW